MELVPTPNRQEMDHQGLEGIDDEIDVRFVFAGCEQHVHSLEKLEVIGGCGHGAWWENENTQNKKENTPRSKI